LISLLKRYWPVLASLLVLWITLWLLLDNSLEKNNGNFIYTLDDPYIHMAIARNLTEHGVWGVTRYEFSSLSSSLIWTLSLSAVFAVFGDNDIVPFVLNVLLGSILLFLIFNLLRRRSSNILLFLLLLAIIFFSPLPALIFTGLEHVLHIITALVFVHLASVRLTTETSENRSKLFFLTAALLPAIRFEGLFMVFVVCLLLLARKRRMEAIKTGICAFLPIGVYGIISAANGWYLLPNSVLLKGNLPALGDTTELFWYLMYSAYNSLTEAPHVLFPLIIVLVIFVLRYSRSTGIWEYNQLLFLIFIVTTFLHMQFADVGWFFRYEAYLVVLSIVVTAAVLFQYLGDLLKREKIEKHMLPRYAVFLMLLLSPVVALTERAGKGIQHTPIGTNNIYQQQYQMGLFLREFYQGKWIVANDIGAVNYLADVRCLDLVGLASMETARHHRNGTFDVVAIDRLSLECGAQVAMIYDKWYPEIPESWRKAGEWKMENNIVAASDVVSIYAVDPVHFDQLLANLRVFSDRLPAGVIQEGLYLE